MTKNKFALIFFFYSFNLNFGFANLESTDLSSESIFLGHLLTPTSELPKKDVFTVGTHVVGYSLNDKLLIGTSSFLFVFYNSPNLYLKYGDSFNEKHKWAIQFNYLKSTDAYVLGSKEYAMEASMLWGIWSYTVTDFYSLHTSLNYMHFFNEGNPHSLRREPFNNQPYQFSLTTLHDIKVSKNYGFASEFGILGLNYKIPNIHGGFSFRYMDSNILIQMGLSYDVHFSINAFDPDEYKANNPTLGVSNSKEFIIHPEVALQYFF